MDVISYIIGGYDSLLWMIGIAKLRHVADCNCSFVYNLGFCNSALDANYALNVWEYFGQSITQ